MKELSALQKRTRLSITNLVLMFALICYSNIRGQGTINFNNNVPGVLKAPVYGPETDPLVVKVGNTSDGIPLGTQTYTGALLSGTAYSAQLYGGTITTTEDSLTRLGAPVSFRTGAAAGFVVYPGIVTVPGVPAGFQAHVQLRAWENGNGTITSYEEAATTQMSAAIGKSLMFTSPPLGASAGDAPNLVGLTSFSLTPSLSVPEPSTIVLSLVGAAAFLLRRKKV